MRLPLALLLALLPTAALADDARPAVDLVAVFVTGANDGATLAFADGQFSGVLKQTAPGMFEAQTSNNGPLVGFAITQKSECIFDIVFSLAKQAQGGIEVDAHKLKTVTYALAAEKTGWTDYSITLEGTDATVVQSLAADGKLSPAQNTSIISTSLKDTDMQAAVAEFQKSFCPAAV
jgi:hypothetical protein